MFCIVLSFDADYMQKIDVHDLLALTIILALDCVWFLLHTLSRNWIWHIILLYLNHTNQYVPLCSCTCIHTINMKVAFLELFDVL